MPAGPAGPTQVRWLTWVGAALLAAGVAMLAWVGWTLLGTNAQTAAAQQDLVEEFQLSVGFDLTVPETAPALPTRPFDLDGPAPSDGGSLVGEDFTEGSGTPDVGEAVALMKFRRPGQDAPLVHEGWLAVVNGVTPGHLTAGPGQYPGTASPGQPGNFAVAGHRTTYGAPFFNLDQVEAGDEVVVAGRAGQTYVYRVTTTQVVTPDDTWVIGSDPLRRGPDARTLTLTTCHPRFSDRQRLIVFAELA